PLLLHRLQCNRFVPPRRLSSALLPHFSLSSSHCCCALRPLHSFPTRRSSDLFTWLDVRNWAYSGVFEITSCVCCRYFRFSFPSAIGSWSGAFTCSGMGVDSAKSGF